MKGTVALVTGANCGIGKQTAVALAAKGATTVLACRDLTKADKAATEIGEVTGSQEVASVRVDLGDLRSVDECVEEVLERFETVDVLVNNAGGYWDARRTTAQGFEQHFGVNYLGHYLLTRRFLDKLGGTAPKRIVSVTSAGHRAVKGMYWDDLQLEHGWTAPRAYGQSKLGQILFGREIARRYGGLGVIAHAAHPGVVRSNFAADGDTHGIQKLTVRAFSTFGVSPSTGARTPVHLASSDEAARSNGGYWARNREREPSKAARDDAAARRLWEVSEELVNASGVSI